MTNRIAPEGKHGRSHRGRPLTQDILPKRGRVSRGIAEEATRELAWLNTGNGVQLMSVQPLAPPIALQPTPLSSLPAVNPLHSASFHQRQLDAYLKVSQSGCSGCNENIYCFVLRFIRIWSGYNWRSPLGLMFMPRLVHIHLDQYEVSGLDLDIVLLCI